MLSRAPTALRVRREPRIETNPGQFVFNPNGFPRWIRPGVIKRRHCHIHRRGCERFLEKEVRAAAGRNATNPPGKRDLPDLAARDLKTTSLDRAPCHIRRTRAAAAIDAMAVSQGERRLLEREPKPTAKAATQDHDVTDAVPPRGSGGFAHSTLHALICGDSATRGAISARYASYQGPAINRSGAVASE